MGKLEELEAEVQQLRSLVRRIHSDLEYQNLYLATIIETFAPTATAKPSTDAKSARSGNAHRKST